MKPEMARFWAEVRSELQTDCGQEAGKRDRERAIQRERLAQELRLSSITLKGFLNGNQKTLARDALPVLLERFPALKARYEVATGRVYRAAASSGEGGSQGDNITYVQMTLQFEGFADQENSFTAHLPVGREGVLTIKIQGSRVA
jgi:hypothetical protein